MGRGRVKGERNGSDIEKGRGRIRERREGEREIVSNIGKGRERERGERKETNQYIEQ